MVRRFCSILVQNHWLHFVGAGLAPPAVMVFDAEQMNADSTYPFCRDYRQRHNVSGEASLAPTRVRLF